MLIQEKYSREATTGYVLVEDSRDFFVIITLGLEFSIEGD